MEELFMWFEISLWIVSFILLLLAFRAVLKAFFPNRAIFRSGNDVRRRRHDEEEEEEEEEDEEMMRPEKATVNGQSELLTATAPSSPRNGAAASASQFEESEWQSQTTVATRDAATLRSTPALKGQRPEGVSEAVAVDEATTMPEGGGGDLFRRLRRFCCCFAVPPKKPSRRKTLEALLVTLLTILAAYFVMVGMFALVYYLFESDFLYGNAVPCPTFAAEECQRNDVDVPCCDYAFDVNGLEKEERFVRVPAGGGSRGADDDRPRYVARVHLWVVNGNPGGEFYDPKRPKYLL